jgi:methylmalonyl-CoA mutase cobalamin-binding subunit
LDPVEAWLELIERFDGGALESELRGSLASLGALTFLQRRIAPLIHALGERWSAAEIGIRHEHFASARIQEFLARHWQPLSDAASGPTAVCATLQGERHTLGLHMAAFTLALNNLRIVFLGADLPATEIAEAAAQHAASAVVLSAARGVDREGLERDCAALRLAIGLDIPIVAGGAGFDPFPTTVLGFYDLSALDEWARGQAASSWLPRVARTYS